MEKGNIANEELIELIKDGFDHVSEEFVSLRTELKSEIAGVRNELSSEISSVRTEISALRSEMHDGFERVDKNFLIVDNEVDKLTVKLEDKNVITTADAKEVMAINPLPLS